MLNGPAATASVPPAATAAGTVIAPPFLLPQQTVAPVVLVTAHAWYWPTAIDLTAPRLAGTLDSPTSFEPQHVTVSFVLIAQVWKPPELISFTVPAAAGTVVWELEFAPQHAARWSEVLIAHVKSKPALSLLTCPSPPGTDV